MPEKMRAHAPIRHIWRGVPLLLCLLLITLPAAAAQTEIKEPTMAAERQIEEQMEALGRDEVMALVPPEARQMMEESGVYEMGVQNLLQLSPGRFFAAVWQLLRVEINRPIAMLGGILGIILLSVLLKGVGEAADGDLTPVFGVVSVLCAVLALLRPILDRILEAVAAIQETSLFMFTFVPVFSGALMAAGQPITGATYNMFLFSACQAVAQVASRTLVPLLGMYLALCLAGALSPESNITAGAAVIKNVVTWALGLMLTVFVALLSVQSMVSVGADSAATKTAKFLLGSFVPVVGSVLSEAFHAAQGCLKLIKTSVGAYGAAVALFTFVPVFLRTLVWYMVTSLGVVLSDMAGTVAISAAVRACATVLGLLMAIILCYGLLLIVSITIVMVTSLGA